MGSEEPLFLGRALKDTESSIVHHFASPGVLDYPDLEAGFFLSRKLVLDLEADLEKIADGDKELKSLFPSDFNIDPAYEFAKFLNKEGKGVELKNVDEICAKKSKKFNCITSCFVGTKVWLHGRHWARIQLRHRRRRNDHEQ